MNVKRVGLCMFAVGAVAVFIVIVVNVTCPGPRTTTLGKLMDKSPGQPAGTVHVSNCGGGKQYGRFLVITSTHKSQHPVVFVLATERPLGRNETKFSGYCEGVCNFAIPDCPILPPFLLITNAVPIP